MFDRIISLTRAYFNHYFYDDSSSERIESDTGSTRRESASRGGEYGQNTTAASYGLPRQVIDDLAVFGIKPPGSLEEVIRARNREMKQYHPDKYMKDASKAGTANEIAQIYNAAFERLKKHFTCK